MNSFDDLIGKRYKKNGRGPDAYDCYGICMEVCRRIDITLPEFEQLLDEAKQFKKVVGPCRAGDLVLMAAGEHHVGVMEDSASMIHTSSQIGSVNRIRKNNPWVKQRVTGVYRYAG